MSTYTHTQNRGRARVDLRDFESIRTYFSKEEIGELQAAIHERGRRRLAREEHCSLEPAEQSDYSPNDVEEEFSEVRPR
jgi:hypothetical protein